MPNYLVESYLVDSPEAVEEERDRARSVADERAGVRYVRTTFVPVDETILHVFEAPSIATLRHAALLAELGHDRIVEAYEPSADPARDGA